MEREKDNPTRSVGASKRNRCEEDKSSGRASDAFSFFTLTSQLAEISDERNPFSILWFSIQAGSELQLQKCILYPKTLEITRRDNEIEACES